MTAFAFDAANPNISIAAMVKHGAVVAPVYIVGTPGGMPHADRARVAALRAAGLAPLPNWERAADFFANCTLAEAQAAGAEALAACRELGFPADGSIAVPFSFDYNIRPADYPAAAAKLAAANRGLAGCYRAIAYGPIGFLNYLAAHGQPGPHWLMASTFRASSQFTPAEVGAAHVAMVQSHDAAGNWLNTPVAGTDINTVTNPHGLGAWWPDGSPYAQGEFTMDAEAAARLDKLEADLTAAINGAAASVTAVAKVKNSQGSVLSLGYVISAIDQHVNAIAAAVNPATLAKAIAAALPAGTGNLTPDQLEAAVETGVRTVFADAGNAAGSVAQ